VSRVFVEPNQLLSQTAAMMASRVTSVSVCLERYSRRAYSFGLNETSVPYRTTRCA
jgi:hypothetical protein